MSDRAPTEVVAAIIRKQAEKAGKPLSYDDSMSRAAQSARIAEQKGNR